MSQVVKSVNKTSVVNAEQFIYTYNISFSDLTATTGSAVLKDFFPSKILYILPPLGSLIKEIREIPTEGGTNVEFDFGEIADGTSIQFTVAASFGPGRTDPDSFTNVADLLINGLQEATDTAQTVHLTLTENFRLRKIMSPSPVTPNAQVTISLILENIQNPGSTITNIALTDVLPSGLSPVASILPTGMDIPYLGYSDPTYNGVTGTWTGNTMNFALPSYSGARYRITFTARVDGDVPLGTVLSNTANWTIDQEVQVPASDTILIDNPPSDNAFLALRKEGPKYAMPDDNIQYRVRFDNVGSVELTDIVIEDNLPLEVDITALRVINDDDALSPYSVYIATSDAPTTLKKVVDHAQGDIPVVDLTPFIPVERRVVYVKLEAASYAVNSSTADSSIFFIGSVNDTAVSGMEFTNNVSHTANSSLGPINGSASVTTAVQATSFLNLRKSMSPNGPYTTLDEIRVTLTYADGAAALRNPVLIDVIPSELRYITGSEVFRLFNPATGENFYSDQPGFPIPVPPVQVIADYPNVGEETVRWNFDGSTIPYNWRLEVRFYVLVAIGGGSTFQNCGYLGNKGDDTEITSGNSVIVDTNDLDEDTFTAERIAKSNCVQGTILTSSAFVLEKEVRGENDLSFGSSSSTTPGGRAEYLLRVLNNQPTNLKNIEIVDILPHVGDAGVILTDTPRLSEFIVYATTLFSAKVRNVITGQITPSNDIVIEYSQSYDPVRFGQGLNDTIGTVDDWSTTPPTDVTAIKSVKVTTNPNFILSPYEELLITFNVTTPIDAPIKDVAFNSFAVKAFKNDGSGDEPLLPVEPNQVKLSIIRTQKSSISNFVWIEPNRDGFFDEGEEGINGITVELYDSQMNVLATTVTSNNTVGEPGFYKFNNLEAGDYFVKFIPTGAYSLTIQQAGAVNGSKPDPATGLTSVINLGTNQDITEIDAGVVLPRTTANIGDFVWIDTNGDGIYTPDEIGINGVTVHLMDTVGTILATTVTSNNTTTGMPGYYLFENLNSGDYVIAFVPQAGYSLTVQQAGLPNGSKPNPETGLTNTINLIAGVDHLTIDAGVIPCASPPVIYADNQCICVGDPFDPFEGVTATDCDGAEIPVIIVKNDVDNTTPGIYEVTYEATSTINGKTTVKTIRVKVCDCTVGPREQAITDIFTSVALEQTALGHILNAEGEKIQKAVALGLSTAEMLAINDSVADMTAAITNLELVLQGKLELFEACDPCGNKCCDDFLK